MTDLYRLTRGNSAGTYYTRCSDAQKRRVMKRLGALERGRSCTGQEGFLVMRHKEQPDWELWRRRVRIADLAGCVREAQTYTLISPEGVQRMRRVKRKPSPIQPMRPAGRPRRAR